MSMKTTQRFREIIKVLGFYGFGYIMESKMKNDQKSPANLRKAFEELGPTFIKMGQILSSRSDILPIAYIEELSKLQDDVPPEKFDDISKVFYEEFNTTIEDAFLYFDKKPLASASVAQVHNALLKDGRNVVVKIQRPNIYEKIKIDISILSRIINLTKARFLDPLIDPKDALDELLSSTELELNFINEGKNIDKFKELNSGLAYIYSPNMIREYSSERVITMERIIGFKINDMKRLKEGAYDLNDIGTKLALSFLKQILEDGFFHGDPHQGNIFIRDGKICYLDFGIMGTLVASLKDSLNDMVTCIVSNDIDRLVGVLISIGTRNGYTNRNALYEDIDYLLDNYLSTPIKNIKVSVMFQEISEVAKNNNIRLPKDFILLIRTLVILEGVIANIAPDINILNIAIPYVKANTKKSLVENLDLDELAISSYKFLNASMNIPNKFIELLNSIHMGRTKIQLEHTNLQKPINEINKMVNRVVFGIIVSAMVIASSIILNSNIGPKIYNISLIGILGYFIAAFLGLYLLISILKSGKL